MLLMLFISSTQILWRHELFRDCLILVLVDVKQLFSLHFLFLFFFSLSRTYGFASFGYLSSSISFKRWVLRLSHKGFFDDFIQLIFLYQYLAPINIIIRTWRLYTIQLLRTQLLGDIKLTQQPQLFHFLTLFGKALVDIIALLWCTLWTHIITEFRLIDDLHLVV